MFNRKAQCFRLQTSHPSLILARKFDRFVLDTPPGYGVGAEHNYYFSHMLNCMYDCRYCFLQGMYRSAHYVVFVNYEDFETTIDEVAERSNDAESWFFSGYDCDSLALEPITGFTKHFLPFFASKPQVCLGLRTKGTQVRSLYAMEPAPNVIVAFSFTSTEISRALEHKVPGVRSRVEAMVQLQKRGWKLGLRFDPVIYDHAYREQYQRLFAEIFSSVQVDSLHSVSLGAFRLSKPFHDNMVQQYPDERLFAGPLANVNGSVCYRRQLESEMMEFCRGAVIVLHPTENLFSLYAGGLVCSPDDQLR